jgi:hypothetical protein
MSEPTKPQSHATEPSNNTPGAVVDKEFEQRNLGEVTFRSIFIGLIVCALVSVWVPLSEFLIGASRMNLSQLPVAAVGTFFIIVILNTFLGRFASSIMLKPAEVLVIFVFAFIAAIMSTSDLLEWVFSVAAVPYYMATPENRWIEDVWPHLQDWWVVPGPSEELRWAFVGAPEGVAIPWNIWVLPMFWWGTFIGALVLASICLASLLRKQWADNERLPFPLVQVPLDIMSNPSGKWNLPEMMQKRSFWIGVSIPMFIVLFNIGNYFMPLFPVIPIMREFAIRLGAGLPNITLKLNMYVVGFAYMVNTNILFSVWFWYLFVLAEQVIYTRVGYSLGERDDLYSARDAVTSWQGQGAFVVFVLISLWMARKHLKLVWLSFLGKEKANDERELVPYRWALPGFFAACLYMGSFLVQTGMSPGMSLVFILGGLITWLGIARVISQTGLVYMDNPLTPQMFTFHAFGTVGIPVPELVGMVATYALVVNGRGPLLPSIFQMAWLSEKIGRSGRKMLLVLVVGFTAAFIIGSAYFIYISYVSGSTTFLSWAYPKHGEQVYDAIIKKMQARKAVDFKRWGVFSIGAVVMAILTWMQYRFPGWPLHPIGFPIAANVDNMVFPVFLTWVIKVALLRIGGVQAYERARPVFLGIIVGYAMGALLSFFIDWFWFPGAGHQIHSW